jgi:spermidine synthase
MHKLNDRWFTEISACSGTAFSIKIHKKIKTVQTPYQNIEIFETSKFGHLMAIDGSIMLTSKENFVYHEVMSHCVLATHDQPKHVVIIGGGDCGTMKEVLKHEDIQSVTQIDIDEQVTRLSEIYFPELCESNHDPRATLRFQDGIKWIDEAPSSSVDILIIDSTDPVGPAEGLFVEKFYQQCRRILKPDGILMQQSESPLIHDDILINMRKAMLNAGFENQLTIPFPQPVYQSGWWSATMASTARDLKTMRTIDMSAFKLKFYNSAIHRAAYSPQPFIQAIDNAVFAP